MQRSNRLGMILTVLAICFALAGCMQQDGESSPGANNAQKVENVPEFAGRPYVAVENNKPDFPEDETQAQSYEKYSQLDSLGRCGETEACVGKDLMPTEKRGSIGQVRPSGWHTVKYDNVDGRYLYNRCHLIGYQLTAENANKNNLITGTRYMNVEGMLPFENMVADYIRETGNHVRYRVTPVYEGDNLLASGVQMEARSVEDAGEGISFNVFVYNVQPGITIDYKTGDSSLAAGDKDREQTEQTTAPGDAYVFNTNTRKFHNPSCSGASDIKPGNREEYKGSRNKLLEQGYEPCGRCRP